MYCNTNQDLSVPVIHDIAAALPVGPQLKLDADPPLAAQLSAGLLPAPQSPVALLNSKSINFGFLYCIILLIYNSSMYKASFTGTTAVPGDLQAH